MAVKESRDEWRMKEWKVKCKKIVVEGMWRKSLMR